MLDFMEKVKYDFWLEGVSTLRLSFQTFSIVLKIADDSCPNFHHKELQQYLKFVAWKLLTAIPTTTANFHSIIALAVSWRFLKLEICKTFNYLHYHGFNHTTITWDQ